MSGQMGRDGAWLVGVYSIPYPGGSQIWLGHRDGERQWQREERRHSLTFAEGDEP